MNSNTVCLRIFFVLFLVFGTGFFVLAYGLKLVTPLAVRFLPTETAEARFANPVALADMRMDAGEQSYRSEITYAGHTTTLVTTTSPTNLVPVPDPVAPEVTERRKFMEKEAEFQPTFAVRFVRSYPSLVVRELPGATLLSYYRDSWTTREALLCASTFVALIIGAFLFRRHLKNSGRRIRRYR